MPHDDRPINAVPPPRRWHVLHELDLARLVAAQAETRALCDALDRLAGRLPALPAPAEAEAVCAALARLAGADREAFWHMILDRCDQQPLDDVLADRLHAHHAASRARAQQLALALRSTGATPPPGDGDALGDRLRCCAAVLRQSAAFESLAILAANGACMTPQARDLLVLQFARSAAR